MIWSLTSEEFYKVKKLRYVFKYRSIQKAVYRRILKGHRKTLHSLVASYMIDQKKRREKLRSRFGKKTNALKAALLWSIQTKHNVPIPAEEDSVMTIKDAQKEREKRNSNLKIHHGMSFAEGSDKAKCPNLALAMVMKRATNKFARGKNKRSSRRFSDYLAVLRDEIRNLEDAPRDKEDQEIAELRKEKYSALALTHAGDITEHMETVSTVHSSLAESTIAFSKSMDTQKQSNGGLFGGNLGEIQEGADGSDEDGGGFDEEDNDDDEHENIDRNDVEQAELHITSFVGDSDLRNISEVCSDSMYADRSFRVPHHCALIPGSLLYILSEKDKKEIARPGVFVRIVKDSVLALSDDVDIGKLVRVRESCKTPSYGWGPYVKHGDIGVVRLGGHIILSFPFFPFLSLLSCQGLLCLIFYFQ